MGGFVGFFPNNDMFTVLHFTLCNDKYLIFQLGPQALYWMASLVLQMKPDICQNEDSVLMLQFIFK